LPGWRLSKRERIVDIIQQTLMSASGPLSEEHLIADFRFDAAQTICG